MGYTVRFFAGDCGGYGLIDPQGEEVYPESYFGMEESAWLHNFHPGINDADSMKVLAWILSHRGISAGHVMTEIARFVPRIENDTAVCIVVEEWRGKRIVIVNEEADKAQALREAIASAGLAVARRLKEG